MLSFMLNLHSNAVCYLCQPFTFNDDMNLKLSDFGSAFHGTCLAWTNFASAGRLEKENFNFIVCVFKWILRNTILCCMYCISNYNSMIGINNSQIFGWSVLLQMRSVAQYAWVLINAYIILLWFKFVIFQKEIVK